MRQASLTLLRSRVSRLRQEFGEGRRSADREGGVRRTLLLVMLAVTANADVACRTTSEAPPPTPGPSIDRDLLDVTIPQLHRLYDEKRYTVTQVVQWHLDRIDRYNGVYGAVETVFRDEALATAARQDRAASTSNTTRGPLRGVPIVVKANTSIKGRVTTAGWEGFTRAGHEFIAPKDATVVTKLRDAVAIIVGHTNMPDFANSDTNRSSSFGRTGNAYDVRVSPGGSAGGTVTAVAANMAVLGKRYRHGQLDSHARCHERTRGRVSYTRSGEHRRHRAA